MFMVVAAVTLARDLIIWGPDFVIQFIFNSEINPQKVSLGAISFGIFMIIWGFKKSNAGIR